MTSYYWFWVNVTVLRSGHFDPRKSELKLSVQNNQGRSDCIYKRKGICRIMKIILDYDKNNNNDE